MKIDLSDTTILIPFRLDSIDRLINLKTTLNFINNNFSTNIHLLEADDFNSKLIEKVISANINYSFIEDHDPIFFRTNYINQMVSVCKSPYISIWDTDIIIPPNQIKKAIDLLRKGIADFTYPYKNNFLETSLFIRKLFISSNDIKILEKYQDKMKRLYPPNPVGGVFFANTKKYIESGMENLNYYGWGVEDGERITRWEKLEYKVSQIYGNLYHLTHSRGINSSFQNRNQKEIKTKELERIRSLTKHELQIYVNNRMK